MLRGLKQNLVCTRTQRLSQTYLWGFESLLQRYGLVVACHRGRGSGFSRHALHSVWYKPYGGHHQPHHRITKQTDQFYQINSCTVKKALGPTEDVLTWGSGKGTENPQGIWLWRPVGFEYRTYTGLENQTLGGHKQNLVCNHHYLHCLHHRLVSGQITGREHSPTHQQKIGLKIYWIWPCPSEQDPVSFSISLSHQEASISLLSLSIRGQTEWKPQSQKLIKLITWTTALFNSVKLWALPCRATQMDGSLRVLTKCDPLEKGMANGFSILALRTPWTGWKGKNKWH